MLPIFFLGRFAQQAEHLADHAELDTPASEGEPQRTPDQHKNKAPAPKGIANGINPNVHLTKIHKKSFDLYNNPFDFSVFIPIFVK
jgi:hypothetical protein